MTTVVEENQLDAITGLSGSGPAYIYYVVEAMERAAQELELETETAKQLIIQTLLGAAEMLSDIGQRSERATASCHKPRRNNRSRELQPFGKMVLKKPLLKCIKAAAAQSKKLGHVNESQHTI